MNKLKLKNILLFIIICCFCACKYQNSDLEKENNKASIVEMSLRFNDKNSNSNLLEKYIINLEVVCDLIYRNKENKNVERFEIKLSNDKFYYYKGTTCTISILEIKRLNFKRANFDTYNPKKKNIISINTDINGNIINNSYFYEYIHNDLKINVNVSSEGNNLILTIVGDLKTENVPISGRSRVIELFDLPAPNDIGLKLSHSDFTFKGKLQDIYTLENVRNIWPENVPCKIIRNKHVPFDYDEVDREFNLSIENCKSIELGKKDNWKLNYMNNYTFILLNSSPDGKYKSYRVIYLDKLKS